ncbi:MAG: hypothetical protein ABEJ75_00070 [Candidatus Nanohaloarchaea archaeon]
MVDERASPSKGWVEIDSIMERGAVSEMDEVILFQAAQSGAAPSYSGRQSTLEEYREEYSL